MKTYFGAFKIKKNSFYFVCINCTAGGRNKRFKKALNSILIN